MSFVVTNLVIQRSVLPPTFKGTPDELFQSILARLKIVSPSGTFGFVIGGEEPTSNVGPWLKDGNQWWVWDIELKSYVPQDISQSEIKWFQIGSSVPNSSIPPVWLQMDAEGNPVGWNLFDGAVWIEFTSLKNKSVTSEKSADGTPEALITFDSNSRPSLVTLGASNEFLMVNSGGTAFEWGVLGVRSLAGSFISQVLGPLSEDPAVFNPTSQSVTITLTEPRDTLVYGYANVLEPEVTDSVIVTLSVDGTEKDSLRIGNLFAGAPGHHGETPLLSRQTLVAGNHILTMAVLAPASFVDPNTLNGLPTVKFIVKLL